MDHHNHKCLPGQWPMWTTHPSSWINFSEYHRLPGHDRQLVWNYHRRVARLARATLPYRQIGEPFVCRTWRTKMYKPYVFIPKLGHKIRIETPILTISL